METCQSCIATSAVTISYVHYSSCMTHTCILSVTTAYDHAGRCLLCLPHEVVTMLHRDWLVMTGHVCIPVNSPPQGLLSWCRPVQQGDSQEDVNYIVFTRHRHSPNTWQPLELDTDQLPSTMYTKNTSRLLIRRTVEKSCRQWR